MGVQYGMILLNINTRKGENGAEINFVRIHGAVFPFRFLDVKPLDQLLHVDGVSLPAVSHHTMSCHVIPI